MSEAVIVKTKEELEKAIKEKVPKIIIEGELAEKVNTALKIKKASKTTVAILSAAIATIPFTGGISLPLVGGIAALTGLEIALILAIIFLGITLVMIIAREYKRVSFTPKVGPVEARLILEKN